MRGTIRSPTDRVSLPTRMTWLLLPFWFERSLSRRRRQRLGDRQIRCRCTPLANSRRNAHQPAWKIEDDQDIDPAQHVLPPRDQSTEIFAQKENDAGADGAPDQRP